MGGGDEYSLDVLKNALKTQRLEAKQREDALKDQLTTLSLRAKREREMLLKEIGVLKGSVTKAAGSPSSRTPASNASSDPEQPGPSGFDLWNLDAEGKAVQPPEEDRAARGGEWDVGSTDWEQSGGTKYRIMSLEAKIQAQTLEIQELQAQLAQHESTLSKQQQRNGAITARLEDRDLQIHSLESKVQRLQRRLTSLDAFAPPDWAPRVARDGSGLSALGERENASLLQGASGHNNWHQEDGSGGEELVPGYNEFVAKLHDASAQPLLGMIQSFVSAFLLKSPKISDHSMVHNFLGAMENPLRSHALWRSVGDEDFALVLDALEAYILGNERVYDSIFNSMGDDWLSLDRTLNKRLWCLQFVQPGHLDIKRAHYSHPAMTMARKNMKRMTQVRAPQEKMECVFRAARVIFRMLNESAAACRTEAASADDFLPIFIYTVLKAHTWRLHSTLEYISLFRNPKTFGGERQYYLVQLQTALAFIAHMDGKSLTMDEAEFDLRLKEREEQWDAKHGNDGGGADGSMSEGLGFSSDADAKPNDSGSDLTSQL